jgi:HSP20 family protein
MMMYRSMFPGDVFGELERLQRNIAHAFDVDFGSSIRGLGRGGFPALNIGSTPRSVEMLAFIPGLDPASIELQLEQGVLTIAGERADDLARAPQQATVQINERFAGRFKRVLSLPDDVDPESVSAHYRDGVLHVTVARREAAPPRRISVH